MTDLRDEYSAACCNVTSDDLRTLIAAEGVSKDALQPSPMFGMATIQTHGTTYEPADEGELAVIVPCGWFDGLHWQLVDLVAFKLQDPTHWWRRLGIADVLGDVHGFTIQPKTLVAMPLDWLRIAGHGICLLDWSSDPVDVLMGAGAITAPESLKNKVYAVAALRAAQDVRNLFND